jgi:hypothetical protein
MVEDDERDANDLLEMGLEQALRLKEDTIDGIKPYEVDTTTSDAEQAAACGRHTAMWFAFLAQEITAQSETHLWTCVFFVLRSPCHVGGRHEAGMHSNTRVNGFLGMQSEDIHTGA